MANIELKDRYNNSVVYTGINTVTLPTSNDGTATFIQPSGSKAITDTTQQDVTAYQYAQVQDNNLVAENIKKDILVLGITGSYEGSIKPAYLLNDGDIVTTLYFNVDYNAGALLPYLTYDQTETITGAGLSYCYLGIGHLSAFDLTNLGLSGEYAVAWADETSGTVVPIYATTAVPAFGVADAGWQVASYTPSSSITVDYTYIDPSFFTVMDEIVAQDDIAFGEHGGGGGGTGDVTFYDYDGSIVTSYSAADFASLSKLPAKPSHDGLIAQGWNWSLSDAKTYVASYGRINIGQMYETSDGKTRIYIHLEEGRLAPYLGIAINGTASVDWGDGQSSTVTGTSTSTVKSTQHTYSAAGDYVITIGVTGNMALVGNSKSQVLWKNGTQVGDHFDYIYQSAIRKVEIGSNVSIGSYAFRMCRGLTSITIPSGVTSIGDKAFSYCNELASITIPSSFTSIGNNAFEYCRSLTSIAIPNSMTSIGTYAFYYCYSLTNIAIPSHITSISDYTFNYCYSIHKMVIPSTVTSIGSRAFSGCYALTSITIPSSVTSIGDNAFQNDGFTSITIPSGVTSINAYAFQNCSALASITIPSGVTSIGNNAFQYNSSAASVTIPSSVTSIGDSAFNGCYGIGFIKFLGTTPPTVANSNAWTNLPTDCKIYVPRAALNTYKSKANYPSSSTYTYVGY